MQQASNNKRGGLTRNMGQTIEINCSSLLDQNINEMQNHEG